MPNSDPGSRLLGELLSFVWDEWSQIGILASPQRESPWAQDPEALLATTLSVARHDPRLFDEVLDWLATNRRLVSARRLRALSLDDEDVRLAEAALQWAAPRRGSGPRVTFEEPEPLFRGLSTAAGDVDEVFLAYGFLRPRTNRTRKSREPDLRAPINLAFRLRELLGVGARAEVVRCLITLPAPRATAAVLTRLTATAKPNVYEATSALRNAEVVSVVTVAGEQHFGLERERWAQLFGESPDWAPAHRDWPQLLGALLKILRWLQGSDVDDASEYLRASLARDLLEEVAPDLSDAGVIVDYGLVVSDAWEALSRTVDNALAQLRPQGVARRSAEEVVPFDAPRRPTLAIEIFRDSTGSYRWRLRAANGQVVATSANSYEARRAARDAARDLAAHANAMGFEVFEDGAGRFRWRARAPSGRVVAQSAEYFGGRSNAQRAARRVREAVSEAQS